MFLVVTIGSKELAINRSRSDDTIVNTNQDSDYIDNGPVGSNHGSLQNPPLLALGHRALRELPRCAVQG